MIDVEMDPDLRAAYDAAMARFSVPEPRCWGDCQSGRTKRIVVIQQYLAGPAGPIGSRMILHDVDRCPDAAMTAASSSDYRVFEVAS